MGEAWGGASSDAQVGAGVSLPAGASRLDGSWRTRARTTKRPKAWGREPQTTLDEAGLSAGTSAHVMILNHD